MEVLSMTDKQWKGWLRRFKRDLEDLRKEEDEKERNKKLDKIGRASCRERVYENV